MSPMHKPNAPPDPPTGDEFGAAYSHCCKRRIGRLLKGAFLGASLMDWVDWLVLLFAGIAILWQRRIRRFGFRGARAPSAVSATTHAFRFTRKPDWVVTEIIRLKAFLPTAGVRTIALTFNRLHRMRESVSKSYVAEVVRKHQYAIAVRRRDIRGRLPRDTPINAVWGLDLCGKQSLAGVVSPILGIVDHGSRFAVMLCGIRNMNFYTLAGHVLIAIGRCGKPVAIRTDNAPQLTSKRFRRFLQLLEIRHQRTDVGSPWQNGRVERFFGTLKEKLNQIVVADHRQLNVALEIFRDWYNAVRPHQNLGGCTPGEVWRGVDTRAAPRLVEPYSDWDGLLKGYRIRW